MPHIEVTSGVGKSASCSQIIPPLGGIESVNKRRGRARKMTTLSLGGRGHGRDEHGIRIQVTLHKPLQWQVSASERKSAKCHDEYFGGANTSTSTDSGAETEVKRKPDPRSEYYRRRKLRGQSGKYSSTYHHPTTEENENVGINVIPPVRHSSFIVQLGRRHPDGDGRSDGNIPPSSSSSEAMTWFKGCASGPPPPTKHNHNHQGGSRSRVMGSAGSRDALAKSRSQSSSALFYPPPNSTTPPNPNTTPPLHSANNGVSASLWDIPQNHSYQMQTSPAKVRHHHPKDKRCNLNKVGNNSRAKLYAVSCPDVAHQALLAHNHLHQQGGRGPAYHQQQQYIPEEAPTPLFILPPPEGYRSVVVPHHQHHHQANCPLSRNLALQQPHHSLTHLHLNGAPSGSQQPPVAVSGGPMSLSYSHLPSSYLLQQNPLMPFNHNHTHHNNHNHNHDHNNHRSRVVQQVPQPQQEVVQPVNRVRHAESTPDLDAIFPAFVIPENIFEVNLTRDGRGLGLSVTGGRDSNEKFPGLIRIKKVFPTSPASECGRIQGYDVILQANGIPLTGLTNQEALSVLRTTPTTTILTLCRPPHYTPGFCDPVVQPAVDNPHFPYNSYNPHHSQETHLPQQKSKSLTSLKIPHHQNDVNASSTNPSSSNSRRFGEFEVTLEKVGGSLGFTLRQEDTSILGHYVRALVKEPALTDGRIQPGDRILSVNGQDLSDLSHGEAINFLRQCGSSVTLRFWRDVSPTPVSPLSPSESMRELKPKPLRQEALDMLNDLAVRKQSAEWKHSLPGSVSVSGSGTGGRSVGLRTHHNKAVAEPATLPRRRIHHSPAFTPSPQVLSAALSRFASPSSKKELPQDSVTSVASPPRNKVPPLEDVDGDDDERSSGSGESTPMSKKATPTPGDPYRAYNDLRSDSIVSTTSTLNNEEQETEPRNRCSSFNLNQNVVHSKDSFYSEPNFRPGQPKYQSAILPSTTTNKKKGTAGSKFGPGFRLPPALFERGDAEAESVDGIGGAFSDQEYPSTFQQSCGDGKDRKKKSLSSTTPTTTSSLSSSSSSSGGGKQGKNSTLLKWKGVRLEDDDEAKHASHGDRRGYLGVNVDLENGTRRSPDGREFRECDVEISATTHENGEQVFTVQLSRRWCSRLGFSLQGQEGRTYISAIYPDSVAAKDGRLRVEDEVVMVNGETIRDLETSQVIDMMRKTRGIISITLLRKNSNPEGNNGSGSGSDSELGLR